MVLFNVFKFSCISLNKLNINYDIKFIYVENLGVKFKKKRYGLEL